MIRTSFTDYNLMLNIIRYIFDEIQFLDTIINTYIPTQAAGLNIMLNLKNTKTMPQGRRDLFPKYLGIQTCYIICLPHPKYSN